MRVLTSRELKKVWDWAAQSTDPVAVLYISLCGVIGSLVEDGDDWVRPTPDSERFLSAVYRQRDLYGRRILRRLPSSET